MNQALIIFVRNPVLGKIKTRIAETLGNEEALKVYIHLLKHTKEIIAPVPAAKFVYYADNINEDDMWNDCEKRIQTGADLGWRMHNAFTEVFADGFDSACIIGSDCHELSSEILVSAFSALQKNDCVIGPATDGGYYLLGMKAPVKELFSGMAWSTETVYSSTIDKMKMEGLSFTILPELNDVDEAKDIRFTY